MTAPDRLPDFIIGGAPRSGTTYLCGALDRHPGIYVAKPFIPEPKVFMGPEQPDEVYRRRYADLFRDAPPDRLLGEKTSYYLESPDACRRIRRVVPGAKLLFIVREPVARAYSNYLWSRQNGLETLPFEQAVALEGRRASPLPPEKSYARPFDYLARGDYAALARRYYDAFGRGQVAFFLYEDIQARGEGLLRGIQQFLGVEVLAFSALDPGVVNALREPGEGLDDRLRAALKERMRPSVLEFARLTGLDIGPWEY